MKDNGFDVDIASGFRGLDSEHHLQLELLGAFRRAVSEARPRDEIDEILDRLIDYTRVHFGSEQMLMRLYQYPQFAQHTDDHDETVEQMQALRRAHLQGAEGLAVATAERLADRLILHITTADRALGFFLVRLGVGPG